ncbi:CRR6 family NdhI maturation factor [Phormidium sp. CLA17]|uniref:CRR6 family NdhI maturation factor n=1 Tax=Leptolyngbya sp. Cla-17 TaxID=2803751 RepID=UPI0014923316|nr:CRR6 family NdhI maturation factor [Leptolyngbya sp. Cla-17]MBM0741451.1 CRR6 family NdhI maturation factor [Leptolyngbya sp. Cla-17]
MPIVIILNAKQINDLDLSPAQLALDPLIETGLFSEFEQQLVFQITFPRDPEDPRELSEISEIRLWFVRLDALYPWLPYLLDWKAGELVRYTAMLVPHQFHLKDGIKYNPEALEIFVMHKIFILTNWMKKQNIEGYSNMKAMAQIFGYELDDDLFKILLA